MAGGVDYPQTPANVTQVNGHYGVFTALVSDLLWKSSSATILPTRDTPAIWKSGTLNIPGIVAADPDALRGVTQPNATAYTAGLLEYIAFRVSLGDLIYNLAVKGEDVAGDAAIAKFAAVYIDSDGELNADRVNGKFFGIALAPVDSGETTTIPVKIAAPGEKYGTADSAGLGDGAVVTSTTDETLTIAQLWNRVTMINASKGSAQALGIPAAANFPAGTRLIITRLVNASAVTITPVAGTIAGGASVNNQDAIGDTREFVANGTDWKASFSAVA